MVSLLSAFPPLNRGFLICFRLSAWTKSDVNKSVPRLAAVYKSVNEYVEFVAIIVFLFHFYLISSRGYQAVLIISVTL
jgi:hypothetical protein